MRKAFLFFWIILLLTHGGSLAEADKAEPIEDPWLSRRAADELLRHLTRDPAFDEPVPSWWDAQLKLSYTAWWITHPKVDKPGFASFTKHFNLEAVPKSAGLTVATDGTFVVTLNGKAVGVGNSPRYEHARRFPVQQFLRKGDNQLTVQAQTPNSAIQMLAMLFIPPDGGFVSDDSWKVATAADGPEVPAVKSKLHAYGTGRERLLGWNVLYKKVKPVGLEIHPPETVKYPLRMLDVDGKSAIFPHGDAKRPVRVVIDFGREVLGYVHVVGRSEGRVGASSPILGFGEDQQATFEIATGEFYEEAKAVKRHRMNPRDSYDLPTGAFDWRHPERRGFRYVTLDLPPATKPLTLDGIYVEYPYYPTKYRGYFLCSDRQLNRIWGVCAYTLRICMQSFYEDGVKRDKWPWMGDARVEAQMNFPVFGDTYLARFTMDNLRGRGKLTSHLNAIPAYSMYWILGLQDYYFQTGDKDYVTSQADEIEDLLDFCLVDLDKNNLYDPPRRWWRFIDWTQKKILYDLVDYDEAPDLDKHLKWTDHQIDYKGAMTAQHALLYDAVSQGATLLRMAGREASAKKYEAIAAKMKAAGNRLLWDPKRGAYSDSLVEGKLSNKTTRQSNAVAVLSGMAPPERHAAIRRNVFHNDDVPQLQTYYFSFYTLQTRYQLGDTVEILDRIRKHWGPLVAKGATTLWERYDPERRMGFGEKFDTNMSHAWGAAPLDLFPKHILGIKQTAPGWTSIRLEPNLHDLQWAQGAVPTPHGDISVWLKRGPKGKVVGRARVPAAIELEDAGGLTVERYK